MIEGANELPVMQRIFARIARAAANRGRTPFEEIARLEPAAFADIGAEYLESTKAFRRTGRSLFVDKLPANWLNVGLIRLALPNATIIDARRHPLACGFSNFKQHYASGVTFAYSLHSIGYFYRDYLRLMAHFDAVQPGKILHVVNERLIENPEREIRRMLDHVGVPFDRACLRVPPQHPRGADAQRRAGSPADQPRRCRRVAILRAVARPPQGRAWTGSARLVSGFVLSSIGRKIRTIDRLRP